MAPQLHTTITATARPSSAKPSYSNSSSNGSKPVPKEATAHSRLTRASLTGSVGDLLGSAGLSGSGKRIAVKAPDRSQVQEELKSVLASTIELTKVLQDQLHELKLKGWNFAARSTAGGGGGATAAQ